MTSEVELRKVYGAMILLIKVKYGEKWELEIGVSIRISHAKRLLHGRKRLLYETLIGQWFPGQLNTPLLYPNFLPPPHPVGHTLSKRAPSTTMTQYDFLILCKFPSQQTTLLPQ